MAKDIISKRTRNELREYLSDYSDLRRIGLDFEGAGILKNSEYTPDSSIPGQRRTLVEQYYNTLNFNQRKDVEKFQRLCSYILADAESELNNKNWDEALKAAFQIRCQKLVACLEEDGFVYQNKKVIAQNHLACESAYVFNQINSAEFEQLVQRLQDNISSDPWLAIGSAKDFVESIAKTILDERQIDYSKNDKIIDLLKKVRKELKLLPEDIHESAKGIDAIKALLGNLGTITQNLAEIRNLYGSGHGKSVKKNTSLTSRHARLAVGSAMTLATFLYETHLERG